MRNLKACGQSLGELALCLAVIAAALAGLQIYLQRGLQARNRDGVKYLFSEIEKGTGAAEGSIPWQYNPYYRTAYTNETREDNIAKGAPQSRIERKSSQWGEESTGLPILSEND